MSDLTQKMRAAIPHVDTFIHLNNAAGSLPDKAVHDAMTAQLDREARRGSTEAMAAVAPQLSELYTGLATLTGTSPDQVMVAGSNTFAWQTIFAALPLREGDRILVGETEWGGNLSTIWQCCRRTGAVMEVIPSDEHGAIDTGALATMLDDRVALVCVTEVPAINGLVNPVAEIADALSGHSAWLFVDAAQAFGQISTKVHPRADLTTASARKFLRAPRGTGFAILSERLLRTIEPAAVDQFSGPWGLSDTPQLRSDARRFEFGEASYAVRLGFLEAVHAGLATDWNAVSSRITSLAGHARDALSALPGVKLRDTADHLSGLVTFTHDGLAPAELAKALREQGINIAAPAAVYAPLWLKNRPPVARLSPHAFNTEAEIDRAVAVIAKHLG